MNRYFSRQRREIPAPADAVEAAKWYKLAAEQGLPPAQLELSALYEAGKGMKRDLVQAYMWAAVAGGQGDPQSRQFLIQLTAEMSETQITQAQELAKNWISAHPAEPEDNHDQIIYAPQP